MENILSLSAPKQAAKEGVRQPAAFNGDKDLFAAFIVNTENAPKPEAPQKAEYKDASDNAPKPADKAADEPPRAETKPVQETPAKADAPAKNQHESKAEAKPENENAVSAANTNETDAPVDGTAPVIDENVSVVPVEPVAADENIQQPVGEDPKAENPADPDAVALPVTVQQQPVVQKKEQPDASQSDVPSEQAAIAKLSAADEQLPEKAIANKVAASPNASERAQEKAASNSAVAAGQADIANEDAPLLPDAAAEANADAPSEHQRNDDKPKEPAAKVIDLQQFAAGGRQASSLLPNPNQAVFAPGSTTPGALQAASQPGANISPNASANADASVAARPLSFLAQQVDSGKAHEVRLARLPTNTAAQIQEQVAIKLRYAAKAGDKSVTINLRPEELGRIDIKLDFKNGNTVRAHVIAESQYTLDMLRKDAPALERVLSEAGLKLDDEGLQFDLRDSGNSQNQQFSDASSGSKALSNMLNDDEGNEETIAAVVEDENIITADGRVDIRI